MKKSLLTIAAVALAAVSVSAQDKKVVEINAWQLYANDWDQETQTYVPRKLDEPTLSDYSRYYYDATNALTVEQSSFAQYRYAYNTDGTVATREQWNNQGSAFYKSSSTAYTYDDQKNIIKTTQQSFDTSGAVTATSGSYFEGYQHGEYAVMKNWSLQDGEENITYEVHYALEFDKDGNLTTKTQLGKDYNNTEEEVYNQPNSRNIYTYENGKLVKDVFVYNSGSATEPNWDGDPYSTTTYVYDAEGNIATSTVVSDTRYGHSEIESRYTYSTLSASYVPQNVTADGTIGNNEVYVKWDAVEGATAYQVLYDNSIADVEGKTEFITPTLVDGEHQVAVLAIVGGEKKNISGFVSVSVKDEGNVPMENFKVNSAAKVAYESYGYVSEYYDLDVSWEVPAGASNITEYTVYVDKGESWKPNARYTTGKGQDELKDSYNDVNSWNIQQLFWWTTFEDTYYDEDTWQTIGLGTGPDCKLWITATYPTGESKPSNVVEMNVAATDVHAIEADANAPVEIYTIGGVKLNSMPARGIYIVKQGNSVKKLLK